jgi:hypothetical protein
MKKADYNLLTLEAPARAMLEARNYYSGFALAHDTYNAISAASDGQIYYVLSSESLEMGGQMYQYDPETDKTGLLGDLTQACGEQHAKAIPQGKSHVRFYESKGKLYFATHVGYYQLIDGMERLPETAPAGYGLYPGGHFLSYDLASRQFEDLARVPGEGIVSMTMDRERGQLYGITWPSGHLVHYDIGQNQLKDLGPVSARGEAGTPGDDYRTLCRSLFVDPRTGAVYFSTAEGNIYSYTPGAAAIAQVPGVDLRLDYFGQHDPTRPGSMGYNWRKIFWHPTEEVAYGVHGNSGYLFRFSPREQKLELVQRITSEPSKKSGMFDQFSYGYLGFQLGPDEQTIYYLTGGPIYIDGNRLRGEARIAKGAAKGPENLHLVTYNILQGKYQDHGPIFYADGSRPTYVNSIAVGSDGYIYTLARFSHEGKVIQDLVKFPDPLA